jgi:proteic killer suppression protein
MIKSFKHKGLKLFFETGSKKGIIPEHADKLARILDRLDASVLPGDMNLPAYKLHKMIGKEEGTWSVWVNGNWRVMFRFEGKDSVLVDYRDYH